MRLLLIASVLTLAVLLPIGRAGANCCFSTAGTTSARLALWEQAATGLTLSYTQDLGYFGSRANPVRLRDGVSDRQLRADFFGLARLSDHVTLLASVPVVANARTAGAIAEQAAGLGDANVGMRYDLRPFDHSGRIGVALVASLSLPTGGDPNRARTRLAVDATGRGTAVATVGASAELPWQPWFIRVDLLGSIPLPTFAGTWSWLSPTIDLTITGGVRIHAMLFLAANVHGTAQLPTAQQAAGYETSVGVSLVFRPDPQWSLLFGGNSSLFAPGLGLNRTAPVSGSLSLRHAFW